MADLRDQQVPLNRGVAAGLEVRETQFTLFVLQAAFHGPAAEGDV